MEENTLLPKTKTIDTFPEEQRIDELCERIIDRVSQARSNIERSIDREMVVTYWLIGREIFEEELHGNKRAGYGERLIKSLSVKLTKKLGKGYATTNLGYMKRFYMEYPKLIPGIGRTLCDKLTIDQQYIMLSWSHYRLLIKINRQVVRDFYQAEAIKNHWSVRELERQIGSLLYDRFINSKNKEACLQSALEGQEIKTPFDTIKDPFILEFLNLPESHRSNESKLEDALISHLQHFLLELGTGFAYVGRQKRITVDGDHFYVDLVFYHVVLKCYVLLEIKTKKVTHADLGQIQFYVNYFDEELRTAGDSPTVGLILCTDKNEAMVKYTLGDKTKQIFASKYQFHLPTEEELTKQLKRELNELKQDLNLNLEDE